ncbi:MAG TPA: hypothetical protein VG406_07510 [Isosphaeraceae bacterium]|jgi:hypothetical protein|nr:hypothetical protein [Isosphaeraceae bacterium]
MRRRWFQWPLRFALVLPVVCALGLKVLPARRIPRPPANIEGMTDLPIAVEVVDAGDGRPVEGARFEVVSKHMGPDGARKRAVTDFRGRAEIVATFHYEDSPSTGGTSRIVNTWDHWLKVSKDGREAAVLDLGQVAGAPSDRARFDVKVALRDGRDAGLGPFEGRFEGEDGETLLVEADGTFYYHKMLCFSEDERFGLVALEGQLLHVRPVGQDDYGYDHFDRFYEPIRWGGRLYLVPPESLGSFCRMVADGLEGRRVPIGFLVRGAVAGILPEGLPEVPAPYRHHFRDRKDPATPIPWNR